MEMLWLEPKDIILQPERDISNVRLSLMEHAFNSCCTVLAFGNLKSWFCKSELSVSTLV